MQKEKIFRYVFIILIAVCVFLIAEYFILYNENKSLRVAVAEQQLNGKVIVFNKLFIEKVLNANSEVSFEDRLKLENAVRDLNDSEILSQWQKFSSSESESDAQLQAKNLLDLLAIKISY